MTTADELSINNLIGNVRNAEKAVDDSKRKCEEIRQYCIDAIRDYTDTKAKLVKIINSNKDLWKNRTISPVSDKDVSCLDPSAHTTKGRFSIGSIFVWVDNVSIYFRNENICSQSYKTISSRTDAWNCTDVSVQIGLNETDLEYNLSYFKWDEKKLREADRDADTWLIIKGYADGTRKVTEKMVREFKRVLEERVKRNEDILNRVENASSQTYRKVGF